MSNWNGKIKCLKSDSYLDFTILKIYDVKNGKILDDNDYVWKSETGDGYNNLNDFNEIFGNGAIFEEISNWNGKLIGIKNKLNWVTKDKIYEVVNGRIIFDDGYESSRYMNIDNLNEDLCLMFEEVLESENLATEKCCNSNVSKSDLPNKIPVLSELLGVKPNEEFRIKSSDGISMFNYFINKNGHLYSKVGNLIGQVDIIAVSLINKDIEIIKLPQYQFTDDEITALKGLYCIGYNFLARDKTNELYVYQEQPIVDEEYDFYDFLQRTDYGFELDSNFFPQIQCGNIVDIKAELDKLN